MSANTPKVHVTASFDGKTVEWTTDEDGTHTPVATSAEVEAMCERLEYEDREGWQATEKDCREAAALLRKLDAERAQYQKDAERIEAVRKGELLCNELGMQMMERSPVAPVASEPVASFHDDLRQIAAKVGASEFAEKLIAAGAPVASEEVVCGECTELVVLQPIQMMRCPLCGDLSQARPPTSEWNEAINAAAAEADEYPSRDPAEDGNGYWASEEIATRIRALKREPR